MMLCYSKTRKIKYFWTPPPKKKAQGNERSRLAVKTRTVSACYAQCVYSQQGRVMSTRTSACLYQ